MPTRYTEPGTLAGHDLAVSRLLIALIGKALFFGIVGPAETGQ